MRRLIGLSLLAALSAFGQFTPPPASSVARPCTSIVTTSCTPQVNSAGALPIGTTLPALPGSSLGATGDIGGARLVILRTANGVIAAHSIVKGATSGNVGPVASDTEGILGVAENATTNSGDLLWVTVQGPTSILCESSTDLNYLIAGTDPTKVKDSGSATLNAISLTTRIIAKAMGACTGGLVTANVIGPYRFGAQAMDASIDATTPITVVTTPGFNFNNNSGAVTYNLPTITPAMVTGVYQRCLSNSVGKAGIITVQAPASTFIDVAGANGSAAGTLVSGGSLGDAVCVLALSTTQYVVTSLTNSGWVNN